MKPIPKPLCRLYAGHFDPRELDWFEYSRRQCELFTSARRECRMAKTLLISHGSGTAHSGSAFN
jgi:hypothetical protein